ncbi:tRNA pseudouridine(38/39) synthase-like [Mya arenaria]|uniref:tRNA pseudouridine(38/39) synthase-like n=1 Tax=Mya arenaria TaxID=6604 RepID=UPI0022E2F94D|nr:tRNA pseudouridine(38/39) synthase-like [Mya arenaria]XP_052820863.1 tRNA pseudouridine(38/39) synthase-like [Mya arenaria]XP_052820864.1 tRNA pseudouridine(38/39) synthase-like [Mya arenaria]
MRPMTDSQCATHDCGRAFLWHQIRSIFSVVFLVGKGKESVEVVDELLNIEKNPRKPQYNMSSDAPLCLYDADFGGEFEWVYEAECHEDNLTSLQQLWAEHSIKATMVKSMLNDLEKAKVETGCDIAPWCDLSPPLLMQSEWLVEDRNPKVLMERQGGLTLDEMIASHESRKQRWRENAEIEAQDDSSEEEMTSRKRQRLEIDKPSHIDDKPFGTLDKPKSGENKDPHIIYGKNNKGDDDTVRDIDGETTNMKADKDICDSKTSLKDNGEENLKTSENGMKGEEKVGRSTQEEIGESSVISQTGE